MGEEPVFPPIPAIGEILTRKDRFIERIYSIIKCGACKNEYSRVFKPGDFIFKKVTDEECNECHEKKSLTIFEIYSEWVDPKKI